MQPPARIVVECDCGEMHLAEYSHPGQFSGAPVYVAGCRHDFDDHFYGLGAAEPGYTGDEPADVFGNLLAA
jgi:hypothetical protein